MKRNDNVVGDCKSGQFWQVRVGTERDEDCAVSLNSEQRTLVYYQRQICSTITRKYKAYADIRGFPWAGASNDSGVVDDGNF